MRPAAKRTALLITFLGLLFFGAFHSTQYVESNQAVQEALISFGYPGAIVLAFVFGVSVIFPIPAATFTPVFAAAGLYVPILIAMFTLGTTLADLVGFYLGKFSRPVVRAKFPNITKRISRLRHQNPVYLWLFVFSYAAFMPLPNEAIIVPLGILGFKLRTFIMPLVLATATHHTLTAYGMLSVLYLFG